MENINENKYAIGSVEKALSVIEVLAHHPEGIQLKEISKILNMTKTTAFRILYTLQTNGFLYPPDNGIYKLNYKFPSLFSNFSNRDTKKFADKYLPELARITGFIPFFYLQDGNYSFCLTKYDVNKVIKINVNAGDRVPLHSTSGGKIFLAAMKDEQLVQWIKSNTLVRKTSQTITDPDELYKNIQEVKRQGYSVNNMENEDNVLSVAAPVHNYEGQVIASVNVSDTILDFKPEQIPEISRTVIDYANKISAEFGYDPKAFSSPFPVD